MHYILYLSLQGLYAAHLESGCPLAIHRDRTIIDANASARQVGARAGLALTEAKATLSGVKFVEWNPDDDSLIRSTWLEGLLEFTDRIETDRPHEAYLDLTGHPDPLSIIPACLERAKFPLVAGLGCSKWVARATTRAPQPLSQDHVVRPELSLRELPTALLPIPEEIAQRLVFLGYRTIGEVQKATREVLVKQFDEWGMIVHAAAKGGHLDPVATNYPPDTIAVRVYMETPWENEEVRETDLRTLASRMGRALVDKDRAARSLELMLIDENGEHERRERTYSKPLRTGYQVLSALRGLAEEVFPAIEARARLSRLEKAVSRQYELARIRMGASSDTARQSIEAVRAKFGSGSVVSGDEWKVPRRKVVLRAWCDATGWI